MKAKIVVLTLSRLFILGTVSNMSKYVNAKSATGTNTINADIINCKSEVEK